jgi:hypothetical protein
MYVASDGCGGVPCFLQPTCEPWLADEPVGAELESQVHFMLFQVMFANGTRYCPVDVATRPLKLLLDTFAPLAWPTTVVKSMSTASPVVWILKRLENAFLSQIVRENSDWNVWFTEVNTPSNPGESNRPPKPPLRLGD